MWIDKVKEKASQLFGNSQQRKWENYVAKKQRKRYKRFNDKQKHPRIYQRRNDADWNKWNKFRYLRTSNVYVEGQNTFLGGLYNIKVYTWYELIFNWLFCLSGLGIVIFSVIWGYNDKSWGFSVFSSGIFPLVIIFVLLAMLKMYLSAYPPKSKLFKNFIKNQQENGVRKKRRKR